MQQGLGASTVDDGTAGWCLFESLGYAGVLQYHVRYNEASGLEG